MAFPASNWFRLALKDALENTSAVDVNALKAALFTSSITGTFNFDTDTDYNVSPWNANEVANGSGYTTGGATLSGSGATITAGVVGIDSTDPSWTSATFSTDGVLVYDSATSNGLVAVKFASTASPVASTLTIQWASGGFLQFA